MDITILISVITGLAALIGVIAGIVQIIEFFQKRRTKSNKSGRFSGEIKEGDKSSSIVIKSQDIPNNIPPRGTFIGRSKEIELIINAIKTNHHIIIEGVGGIGKTSLALEVAHEILHNSQISTDHDNYWYQMFDAIVWITAKGVDLSFDKVIDSLARTLDYPYILHLQTSDKNHEILKLLRVKKVLIFIDNFESVQDQKIYDFISEIPESSKLVLTTRIRYSSNSPFVLSLRELSIDEGLELIRKEGRKLGLDTIVSLDDDLLIKLINVTGGSPLAIRWSMGQIKQKGQTFENVLDMLRNAKGDIFENIFLGAWSNIDSNSKTILQGMTVFADTVSRETLYATTDLVGEDFSLALGKLIELWLIETNREILEKRQRFSVHALTRAFVARETSVYQVESYWWRAADHFLKFCNERKFLNNGVVDYDEIELEVENILRIIDWLEEQYGQGKKMYKACEMVVQYSDAINVFFWSRGYWVNRIELCKKAMKACELLHDWRGAGRQAYYIGIVYVWQGKVESANEWAKTSYNFMKKTDEELSIALAERLMGLVYMISGNYVQATVQHKKVLDILSKSENIEKKEIGMFADWVTPSTTGNMVGVVSLLQELGIIANKSGDYESAKDWLERSAELANSIQDGEGLSVSCSHLGFSYLGLQRLEDARVSFEKGLELANKYRRKSTLGRCNQGLATIHFMVNDFVRFERYANLAIDYFMRLGMDQEKQQVETQVKLVKQVQ